MKKLFILVALVAGLLGTAFYLGTAPALSAGGEVVLLNIGNKAAVKNGPSIPTRFSIRQEYVITVITNYHWNNGRGSRLGSIGLKDSSGRLFGPWAVTGAPGQGGVPNAVWTATPNAKLPAGEYTVVDSDPTSWSQNAGSGGRGFSVVKGYPWPDIKPTPTPAPNPTPKPTSQSVFAIIENRSNHNINVWTEGREPRGMQGVLESHVEPGWKSPLKVTIPVDGRIKFVYGEVGNPPAFGGGKVYATCIWNGDPKDKSRTPHIILEANGNFVCSTDKK